MRPVWSRLRGLPFVVAPLVFSFVALAAPLDPAGDADTTFSGDGKHFLNFTSTLQMAEGRAVAVQPLTGKIVIGGGSVEGGTLFHFALVRLHPDGTQDTGFGQGGAVKTVIGANDYVEDLAIQDDGKIIAVGWSDMGATDDDFTIARYTVDGALDPTFGGGDGIVTVDTGVQNGQDRGNAVAIAPNGKIVVVGECALAAGTVRDACAVRLNTDGTLDSGFSSDGRVKTNLAAGDSTDRGRGVAVQPDGKIVLGGSANAQALCAVARYNADGSLDSSFDGDGISTATPAGWTYCQIRDIALDASNRIVATARGFNANRLTVLRFSTAGAVEWSNSLSGTGASGTEMGLSLELTNGGVSPYQVIAFGWSDRNGVNIDFLFTRWNENGTPDNSFGPSNASNYELFDLGQNCPTPAGGYVTSGDQGTAVALTPSGRIVGVGMRSFVCAAGDNITRYFMGAAQVNADGSRDNTFGPNGNGTFYLQLQGGSPDAAYGMALQADGKPVLVGSTTNGGDGDFAAARFNTDGSLDTGFSGDGRFTHNTGAGRQDLVRAVVVRPGGEIVMGGGTTGGGAPSFTIVQVTAAGALDTTFGTGGVRTLSLGSNSSEIKAMALQPDGKLVVVGTASNAPADWFDVIARFTVNGTLDNTFGCATPGTCTGYVTPNPSGMYDALLGVAVKADGKIVAVGSSYVNALDQTFSVMQLGSNGVSEWTRTALFGPPGEPGNPSGPGGARDEARAVVAHPDGRITVGGRSANWKLGTGEVQMAVARFLADGTPDTSIGAGGKRLIALGASRQDEINAMALQFDEKVMAFGTSYPLTGGAFHFTASRLNWNDASLDTTYGTSVAPNPGYSTTEVGGGDDFGYAGALTAAGGAFQAGSTGSGDFGVAKLQGDPAPTPPSGLDLATASDSTSPNASPAGTSTDNLTNVATPTFTGACTNGETVILRVGGADTTPLTRVLCSGSAFSLTSPALTDGARATTVISRNGAGNSAAHGPVNITIDTVAAAVSIGAPAAAATVGPNPTVSGAGAENGAYVLVTNQAGGGTLCAALANTAGAWSCGTTLGPGSYTVVARQTDRAGTTSASTSRAFTVSQAPTTTAISTTPATQSVFGQAVQITGTVDAGAYSPATGTVNFLVDAASAGSPALLNGAASITRSNLAVGAHTFSVSYPGATGFLASGPAVKAFTVVKASTTTTISVTPEPSVVGQPVTIDFTVAPVAPGAGAPTGLVTVSDGAQSCTGSAPSGSCTLTYTSPGARNLTASYAGDGSFNGSSTAAASVHTVGKASTTVAITSDSPDPSVVAEAVTVNVTVTAVSPGAGTRTGTVSIGDGVDSCTATVSAAGTGSCTLSLATMGNRTLTAAYSGDASFTGSTGTAPHEVQNRAPVVNDQALPAVAENSAPGTVVGTVSATEPDAGQSLAYAITAGNASGAFAIDPLTGQVTVASAGPLNFEATPSFTLTVQATDNGSPVKSDTGLVTIALADVNEAPSIAAQARGPVAESAALGALVGAVVTAADPDAGQSLAYAITAGNTGNAFAIDPATGQITVASALDFETKASYALMVSVTDTATSPLASSAVVTVTLSDANEAPVVSDQAFAATENPAAGAVVGTLAASDVDAGQALAYAITGGNVLGGFAVHATTGQITVANRAVLDHETNPSFALTVSVTDNGAPVLSDSAVVTITLADANDAPVLTDVTLSAVPENGAAGTVAGTVTAADQDAAQALAYAISSGNTAGAFAIDGGIL